MIKPLLTDKATLRVKGAKDEFGDYQEVESIALDSVKIDINQTLVTNGLKQEFAKSGKLYIYPHITPFFWQDDYVDTEVTTSKGDFVIKGVSIKVNPLTNKVLCYEVMMQ